MVFPQFLQLQQDYEYNLELLDGRDAELEKYDTDFEGLKHELSARNQLAAQLRSELAHADSGMSTSPTHTSFAIECTMWKLQPMSSLTLYQQASPMIGHVALLCRAKTGWEKQQ